MENKIKPLAEGFMDAFNDKVDHMMPSRKVVQETTIDLLEKELYRANTKLRAARICETRDQNISALKFEVDRLVVALNEAYAKATKKSDDGEGLDPVGKEDGDVDNDGDKDSSDEYLKNRRKTIAKNIEESEEITESGRDHLKKMALKEERIDMKAINFAFEKAKKEGWSMASRSGVRGIPTLDAANYLVSMGIAEFKGQNRSGAATYVLTPKGQTMTHVFESAEPMVEQLSHQDIADAQYALDHAKTAGRAVVASKHGGAGMPKVAAVYFLVSRGLAKIEKTLSSGVSYSLTWKGNSTDRITPNLPMTHDPEGDAVEEGFKSKSAIDRKMKDAEKDEKKKTGKKDFFAKFRKEEAELAEDAPMPSGASNVKVRSEILKNALGKNRPTASRGLERTLQAMLKWGLIDDLKLDGNEFTFTLTDEGRAKAKALSESLEDLNEAKELNYTPSHKSFTSAVLHAKEALKKAGYEVDAKDWESKVNLGPRKPGKGKTNNYQINMTENGKRKVLEMQIYFDEGRYELNMYVA